MLTGIIIGIVIVLGIGLYSFLKWINNIHIM